VRSSWKEAADRKDSTAIAAFYEDDAILASSGGPVSNGKAAIEAAVGRLVNAVRVTSIDSKDLTILGDDAFDYGTYNQEVTGPDGKVSNVTGYYIVHLHRQSDGSWKIRRHLDVVPPNPPAAP
jgi:ketosteroid isomerase-like protein